MADPIPFTVAVSPDVLADLDRRLHATRWPPGAQPRWDAGVDQGYLRALVERWRNGFDWTSQVNVLNRHPQYLAEIDGHVVHFLHVRGRGQKPFPLLLTHGWPSTCWEFLPLVEHLSAMTFDLVIPSLPGFAFSPPVPHAAAIPGIWHRLMTDVLGYPRYGAHGGDIGAMVTNRLALDHPDNVAGIHVTMPAEPTIDPATLTCEEHEFLAQRRMSHETDSAYAHAQRTRPDTLAAALNDSPAGLAAWIIDKWRDWSARDGDLATRFSMDDLLTTITLYWVTGTIGTSFAVYRDWALGSSGRPEAWANRDDISPGVDSKPLPPGQRITTPAAVALFDHPAPPAWARRAYADLRTCARMPRGGHFPALTEPALLAGDIRDFFSHGCQRAGWRRRVRLPGGLDLRGAVRGGGV
ncbi:epoxide hydrolase family protein [Actinophytocola gossypii]|uniref:Alpha/beta fold hydrolase n=1 Tax=Actinophytocola gossypii TaxID=2812003 RepID=A0ABT2JA42_9PSEU|nr:epoxide hydrolase family protein [Actinophytocola gossypii]MCT2584576.1 alpha/beta fold hydrolase [Actinophytocola gossypii]